MKYYINYEKSTGEILGFLTKDSDENESIEVEESVWHEAQSYNTIIVNTDGVCSFSTIDHTTDEDKITTLSTEAKTTRDAAISSDLLCEDLAATFQVSDDATYIRNVISDAEAIGSAETDSTTFRLADNTWRETTLAELRTVLVAFIERKKSVWEQFSTWDSGDKTEEFEVTL